MQGDFQDRCLISPRAYKREASDCREHNDGVLFRPQDSAERYACSGEAADTVSGEGEDDVQMGGRDEDNEKTDDENIDEKKEEKKDEKAKKEEEKVNIEKEHERVK